MLTLFRGSLNNSNNRIYKLKHKQTHKHSKLQRKQKYKNNKR